MRRTQSRREIGRLISAFAVIFRDLVEPTSQDGYPPDELLFGENGAEFFERFCL